jgi:LuxR family transcriptional regulator, maltose regulon positive regulatory protein
VPAGVTAARPVAAETAPDDEADPVAVPVHAATASVAAVMAAMTAARLCLRFISTPGSSRSSGNLVSLSAGHSLDLRYDPGARPVSASPAQAQLRLDRCRSCGKGWEGRFSRHEGMTDTDIRLRADRPARAGGAAFDLIAAKLMRPVVRPGTIRRSSLPERLARDDAHPIVSVVAPAGYGKTTLLAQWAEADTRAFAWVSADEADNDPRVLLAYIAAALDAVEPVGRRVFDALASPASSVLGSVVPRLCNAFASVTSPVTLVLDDVHLLHNREGQAALSVLAEHVPAGSRLVFASRDQPPVQIARLRAAGQILEIGAGDLSLTAREAASLLAAAEVRLGEDELAELHRRTEGWAAGLYLAALSLREGGSLSGTAASFAGDDRFISEYLESEFLARISRQQRAFLTRTAVLERISGPLCEAVLDLPGAGAVLAELARSNLLLVPLDRRGQWYRYHHLFRDMLRAELERAEPALVPVLRRRAAGWCQRNDLPEEALEYFMAAGDVQAAARLVETLFLPVYRQARIATLQRWFRWLDDRGGMERHPLAAIWASFTGAVAGRPAEAERWADAVDRWEYQDASRPADPVAEAWAAALRYSLCRRGVEQMRADADEAAARFAAAGIVAATVPAGQGIARVLCGDLDGGDAFLEKATTMGDWGAPSVIAQALCMRALIAMERHRWDRAEALASQARSVLDRAGIEKYSLLCAVKARLALHRGDAAAARRELVSAQELRPLLTYASPHLAIPVRVELIRVHLALSDLAGARTLMREVDELLKRRPGMGTLVGEAGKLRVQLAEKRGSAVPGASALTAAEMRLLPMMSTHLQLQEIAAELYLSPHTVRAQSKSIYRKLGAANRNQAIARARELGLLDG